MRLIATLNSNFDVIESTDCTGTIRDQQGRFLGTVIIRFGDLHEIEPDFSMSSLSHYQQAVCIVQVSKMLDSHFDDACEDVCTEMSFDA